MSQAPKLKSSRLRHLEAGTRSILLGAALETAALYRRQLRGVSFIGITGSAGKTTTKALMTAMLQTRFGGRSSPVSHRGVTCIRDDWKAPQWSIDAAFAFLADARARRRIAVIGFESPREASAFLSANLRAGDLVLIKGSNRADHLLRLALAYQGEVGCWRVACGRGQFCDGCEPLHEPADEGLVAP